MMFKSENGMTRKNRLAYPFFILVIIIVIGLIVSYSYLNSENFRVRARSLLITELENLLQKRIEIGSVDAVSFQSLDITHLVVLTNDSDDAEILFRAGEVKIKFALFFPFWQGKPWQLDIKNITFSGAIVELTRNLAGEFDLAKKLGLDLAYLSKNIKIEQVSFQNSFLEYHDELIYHYPQAALTTKAKSVRANFNLSYWPKVVFDSEGIQDKDDALLSLGGFFVMNGREYSLDFHLQNADITHFQYYLEAAKSFNVTGGKFDLDLNLSFSPEWDSDELLWQGKAVFHQASAEPHFLKEIPLLGINGEANFNNPEITLSEMTGLYQGSPFRLEGLVLTKPVLYYDLNITGTQVEVSLLRDDILLLVGVDNESNLQGKVDLSGNIKGLTDSFNIQGTIDSSRIALENIPFPNLTGSFLLSQEELIIDSLQSKSTEGLILVEGKLNWSPDVPLCHLDIKTSGLSFQNIIFRQFPSLAEFSGIIDSNFHLENRKWDNENNNTFGLTGKFAINNLEEKEFAFPKQVKGEISASLNLADGSLLLEQCDLISGKNNGFLKGEFQLAEPVSFALDGVVHIPDLTIFSNTFEPETKIAGSASLQGRVRGTWENPIIDMGLKLNNLSVQDYQITEFIGQLSYQQNTITVESYNLASQNLVLVGDGEINISPSVRPEIHLSYQLQPLTLERLWEKLNYSIPLTGLAEGSGYIRGSWPELTMSGHLQLEGLTYQEYRLGHGKVEFLLQPDQAIIAELREESSRELFGMIKNDYILNLEYLQLQNEVLQLNAKGKTGIGKDYPFSLEVEFVHRAIPDLIEHFYPSQDNLKKALPSQITGMIMATGNSTEQEISLSSLFTPQQQGDNPPSKLEASLIINQKSINISDFQLTQSDALLKAEGAAAFYGNLDIHFETEQLDIAALMNIIQIEGDAEGAMNLKGSITGEWGEPNIVLTTIIKNGCFRGFQFENLKSELLWDIVTDQIEINELTIDLGNQNNITVKGNIPITNFIDTGTEEINLTAHYRDVPLNLEMKMDKANLNLLKVFWPKTFSEISGTADLEFLFTGTTAHPLLNGKIEIHEGVVSMAALPVQIGEINSLIKIENNMVIIPSTPFYAYENKFNLSGEFMLAGFLPDSISFTLTNQDNKITYQDILESEIDLELSISNLASSPHISGQIFLTNGILSIDNLLKLEEDINLIFSSSALSSGTPQQLAVGIELQDPFQLKVANAEILIAGKAELTGTLAEPLLQSTITLKKGYVLYFDKKFSIIDGLVTMNGTDRHDIELNARASTNVQGVQININVLGNLSDPQILLSSQPALKETEILSLLTFNRNIQGLSEGDINQILSQEMLEVLFQSLQISLFNRIEHKIATGLGLEYINISLNGENNGGSYFLLDNLRLADLTLEMGKNIGDDVFISYSTPLDFNGETSLGMDYKLSPAFTFTTQLENFSFRKEDYKIRFGLELKF